MTQEQVAVEQQMDNLLKRADLAIYEARGIRADIPTNNRQLGFRVVWSWGIQNPD